MRPLLVLQQPLSLLILLMQHFFDFHHHFCAEKFTALMLYDGLLRAQEECNTCGGLW